MSFNLIDQPWIPVITQDFQVQEVSLSKLFQTWETWREIQADNPPTTLALYRLLLAILHRTYQGPRNEDHWEEIFEDNGQEVIAYLNQWRDRFDLLHPDHPFMQDPILPLEKAVPIYALHAMSAADKSHVFSHTHEWSGYSISLSQSARLIVRLQGVNLSGTLAAYTGFPNNNRSAVNTPTINAANVLVRGGTLKQTLLFNLMRYDPASEIPSVVTGEDLPSWETSYAGNPRKTSPQGYISYLSFPWRRLRLFPEDTQVSQLAITMGNSLPDKVSPQQWECGIAYREDKPVKLSLTKQLWRNADVFLLTTGNQLRPRIVDWLANLKREGLVEDVITLQISGLSAMQAKPLGWSWEQFSAPIQYVTDGDLAQTLKIAITIAKSHQRIFGSFQGSPYYALARELNPPNASKKAISQQAKRLAANLNGGIRYWSELDREFLKLLNTLPQDSYTGADGITLYGNTQLPVWTQTIQTVARQAFTYSIASIRNYQARAAALCALEWELADLRASPEEKDAKKAKAAAKKKEKVAR